MSKIYQGISALIFTTTTVMAGNYGGFFIGGGLGAAALRNEAKYTDTTQGKGKLTANKLGAYYQVHAGYLHEVGTSKTMIGGDIFLNSSSAKKIYNIGVNNQPAVGTLEQKRSTGYGIAAIAGKLVNPKVMVYGRLGYEMSRYEMKLALVGQAPQSSTKSYSGVVPGVGMNYKVTPNVLVGLGYDYAGFFAEKVIYSAGTVNLRVKPVEHRVMLKVSFVFAASA